MNVCMAVYSFYEGDNRVRRYAEALAERGDNVDVIALRQDGAKKRAVVHGVTVHKIQRRQLNEKRSTDYAFRLALFLVRSFLLLTVLNYRKRFQAVHIHSVPDFLVFAALAPKMTGARVVLDIHDIVPELFCSKFKASRNSAVFQGLLFMERISTGFADHVIVANHLWSERLVTRSVPQEKCTVVMNYPDPRLFANVQASSRSDEKFRVLYPGTLTRHQGLDCAIEAVTRAHARVPQIDFQIFGKGTDEEYFRSLVHQKGADDFIHFNGPVSMERVAEEMVKCDLGLEPKLKESFGNEAFSTKILEFMLAGVPVVVSDTDIHKRYIPDNLVKYFRSGDAQDCADAVLALCENAALREEYIGKGKGFVEEFAWDAKKSEYLSLVDALVESGNTKLAEAGS